VRETKLYSRIEPKLNDWGASTRVENAMVGSLPDIHYCIDGRLGWIETKLIKSGKIYFEKFQAPWVSKQEKAGCKHLFILAGVNDNSLMYLYDYREAIRAPREIIGKWRVIKMSDLTPLLTLDKPYDWMPFKTYLVKGVD